MGYVAIVKDCLVNHCSKCSKPIHLNGLCKQHYNIQHLLTKPACSEVGCILPSKVGGMCTNHYQQHRYKQQPRKICSVAECTNFVDVSKAGLCKKHYRRQRTTGSTHIPTREDRFWKKVNKNSGQFYDGTECWLWTGALRTEGYGQFRHYPDRPYRASHHVAYELLVGPINKLHRYYHLCEHRNCVNPEHIQEIPFHKEVYAQEFTQDALDLGMDVCPDC